MTRSPAKFVGCIAGAQRRKMALHLRKLTCQPPFFSSGGERKRESEWRDDQDVWRGGEKRRENL